jgi:hypothetical protein
MDVLGNPEQRCRPGRASPKHALLNRQSRAQPDGIAVILIDQVRVEDIGAIKVREWTGLRLKM